MVAKQLDKYLKKMYNQNQNENKHKDLLSLCPCVNTKTNLPVGYRKGGEITAIASVTTNCVYTLSYKIKEWRGYSESQCNYNLVYVTERVV